MGVEHVEPLQALALLAAGDRAAYRAVAARILALLNTKAHATYSSYAFNFLLWPLVLPAGESFDLSKPVARLGEQVAPGPTAAENLCTLGAALLRSGKTMDAIRRLEEACHAQPEDLPSAWLLLAIARHRAGDPAEAKKWFDRAAKWLGDPHRTAGLEWFDRLKLRLLRMEYEQRSAPS